MLDFLCWKCCDYVLAYHHGNVGADETLDADCYSSRLPCPVLVLLLSWDRSLL